MAALPVTPLPAPEPVVALSEPTRIINTFVAPSKTFTDLRRSAAWWGPFLIMTIVALGFVYVVDQKIGFRKVAENQIQLSPKAAQRIDQLPASQRSGAIDTQAKIMRYSSYGFMLIVLIWDVIVAAILFATFKFGASAQVTFSRSFAVVMYASLPGILKSILAVVSILAGVAADSFTMQNPVATNPAYFMNPADSHFLYGIASALDIFMIWTLVLTAIGFSVVGKVKRSTAMVLVFGWYIFFTLVSAGLGAAFS
jgi:Yip1 domain